MVWLINHDRQGWSINHWLVNINHQNQPLTNRPTRSAIHNQPGHYVTRSPPRFSSDHLANATNSWWWIGWLNQLTLAHLSISTWQSTGWTPGSSSTGGQAGSWLERYPMPGWGQERPPGVPVHRSGCSEQIRLHAENPLFLDGLPLEIHDFWASGSERATSMVDNGLWRLAIRMNWLRIKSR